jgi:hypothetical protein
MSSRSGPLSPCRVAPCVGDRDANPNSHCPSSLATRRSPCSAGGGRTWRQSFNEGGSGWRRCASDKMTRSNSGDATVGPLSAVTRRLVPQCPTLGGDAAAARLRSSDSGAWQHGLCAAVMVVGADRGVARSTEPDLDLIGTDASGRHSP